MFESKLIMLMNVDVMFSYAPLDEIENHISKSIYANKMFYDHQIGGKSYIVIGINRTATFISFVSKIFPLLYS